MGRIKVTSFNVNGIHNPIKRGKILSKLKREKTQIALLQETHLNSTEHVKLGRMGFKHVFFSSHESGNRRGTAILISNSLNYEHMLEKTDKEGRYVLVRGKIDGIVVTLFNVYAPPNSEWDFYRKIFDIMTLEAKGIFICGGDWNVKLNEKLDSSRPIVRQTKMTKKINVTMREMGIIDVWRDFHPVDRDYTHYSHPHSVYTRIDYFFMYNTDRHRVDQCDIGNIDISDHSPIYLTISLHQHAKHTYWKLNSSILNSVPIKEELEKEINNYFELNDTGEVEPPMLWDAFKAVMRGNIIARSSYVKKLREERLNNLQQKLKQLQRQHKDNLEPNTERDIKTVKNEIDSLLTEEVKKKLIYLKQKYWEAGGKATKLLAYRLKKKQADSALYKIRNTETKEIEYKQEKIKQCLVSFYKKLYSQQQMNNDEDIDTFLMSLNLPTVTEAHNNILRAEVTTEEINQAITRLKAGSSPGLDGFTTEWYKIMRDKLVFRLMTTFNWILKKHEMPPSWREAVISLIPKEGKNRQECENLRPISVLNVDYRIFTSILARRLENCLPSIIHLDQTGFIKQRQTQDNIRRTLHIIRHIVENNIESTLISLDAFKAFDTVSWKFLYKTLNTFGFHENFIKVIEALYDRPTAKIRVNGDLTTSFSLQRGCRQGCAVSPLLFAIFIEPLSQWIRQDTTIRGISAMGGEQKLALFADDILIYLEKPSTSLPRLMSCMDEYSKMAGYKLNLSKTQILAFNYKPPIDIKQRYQLKWENESIKYLGIHLPKKLDTLFQLNYQPLNSKIKEDIKRWQVIPFLTLGSRVDSVKMNILPRLLYLFQTLPIEVAKQHFVEWDKQISRYIWNGQRPRIKYKTLQLQKKFGGMGLPCLLEYYYAAQLRPIICWCNPGYSARWKDLELAMCSIPLQAIVSDDVLIKYLLDRANPFINLSLKIWKLVQKQCNIQETAKILRWCSFDSDFPPNLNDARFRVWMRNGITAYCTVMHKESLKTFQMMEEQYHLERQDFYRFLQMRHHFEKLRKDIDLEDGMIKLFISAYKSENIIKTISKIYNYFSKRKSEGSLYIKQRWDKESGNILSEDHWYSICQIQWKTTTSLAWREFSWKNMVRFFLTPKQKSYNTNNTACWRQCHTTEANHYHIFWSCPSLTEYWKKVHQIIQDSLIITIPLSFDTLYLCNFPHDLDLHPSDARLIPILLAACKKAITRKWLKPQPPSVDDWIDIVYDVYKMERLTYSLRMRQNDFSGLWNRFVLFIGSQRPDFI